MLNVACIMGRLTADPELRYTQGNTAVVRITLACNRPTRAGAEEQTDFIDVTAWGKTAEFVSKYFIAKVNSLLLMALLGQALIPINKVSREEHLRFGLITATSQNQRNLPRMKLLVITKSKVQQAIIISLTVSQWQGLKKFLPVMTYHFKI